MTEPRHTRRGSDAQAGFPSPRSSEGPPGSGSRWHDDPGIDLGRDPDHPRRTNTQLHGGGPSTETLRYGEEEPEGYDEDGSHDEIGGGRPENANTAQFGRDSETDEWHRSQSHPALGRRGGSAPEARHSSQDELVNRGEGYRGKGRGLLP
jgi:hypothetical protein